jgi:hypothetical protein
MEDLKKIVKFLEKEFKVEVSFKKEDKATGGLIRSNPFKIKEEGDYDMFSSIISLNEDVSTNFTELINAHYSSIKELANNSKDKDVYLKFINIIHRSSYIENIGEESIVNTILARQIIQFSKKFNIKPITLIIVPRGEYKDDLKYKKMKHGIVLLIEVFENFREATSLDQLKQYLKDDISKFNYDA